MIFSIFWRILDLNNFKYLFDYLDDLEDFKRDHNTAIITDIDGTISKIVPTPMEAVVSDKIKDTMERIAHKFKFTGVMTGRSIENARQMMENKNIIYIGNHGLEQFINGEIRIDHRVKEYIPLINKVGRSIQKELEDYDCILFQDKKLSFTVHYRLCDNSDEVRKRALNVINGLEDSKSFKIVEGRKVIEIRPPVGHDKGTIIQKFIEENKIKKIIYLGDDVTDSDAFYKLKEFNEKDDFSTASIVVISKETPDYVTKSADFYVKSVDEVHKFFKWLCDE